MNDVADLSPRACEQCGDEFTPAASRARFCSKRCCGIAYRARNMQPIAEVRRAVCIECGSAFAISRSDVKFCSSRCNGRHHRRNGAIAGPADCLQCGKPLVNRKRDSARYCDQKCASLHWYYRNRAKRKREYRECPACGEAVQRHANAIYCSGPCQQVANRVMSYGLTLSQYTALLESQGNVCAICGGADQWKPDDRGFHIDHDHETGRVRGVLCPACNLMLGYAKDNPGVLLAAADYLRQSVESPPPLNI